VTSQLTRIETAAEASVTSQSRTRWRPGRLRGTRRGLRLGVGIVAGYVLIAVLAPVIAPYGPTQQNIPAALQGPSGTHLLGTDALGRDVLSRLFYAARYDLMLGVAATGLGLLAGTVIGLLAGYFRRGVDAVVSRIIDLLMAIPLYPLLVLFIFVLGGGPVSVIVALAAADWVGYARLTRSQVLVVREQDYIAAARLGGLASRRVILRHVLPNVSTQLVVLWTSDIVAAISTIAALGYLGIGIQPPTAEWGVMVYDGQNYLLSNWRLSFIPGVAIVLLGVGLALISDGLAGRVTRR